jgi:hypothetical protein
MVPSGHSDALETLLLSLSLAPGHHSRNPPLFFWLAHAAIAAAGPSLPVVYALRLGAVFAACAGFTMLATLHFHWYLLFHLTNTALALLPPAVLAFLRAARRGGSLDWALFGLAAGAGMLARYNFAIAVEALVLAALSHRHWRPRLLRLRWRRRRSRRFCSRRMRHGSLPMPANCRLRPASNCWAERPLSGGCWQGRRTSSPRRSRSWPSPSGCSCSPACPPRSAARRRGRTSAPTPWRSSGARSRSRSGWSPPACWRAPTCWRAPPMCGRTTCSSWCCCRSG